MTLIPSVLRENRPFALFWTGQTVSFVGDQVTLLALPLVGVLVLHGDAAQMGYLAAAGLVPNLLFSLHAGAWVDRRGRRRQLMVTSDVGRAILVGAIPVAFALHLLSFWFLYTIAFLVGTLNVLFFVSYQSLVVALVPRERFIEANSLINGSRAFSSVAGQGGAGALVSLLTAPGALQVDAASFLVSAFCLSRISPADPPPGAAGEGRLLAGVRFILGSATMRSALLATATINLGGFVLLALFVLFATTELGVNPVVLGLILGGGAVGGLVGSTLTARIGRRIGVGPTFVAGCTLFPSSLLLIPAAHGPHPLVLAMLFTAEFAAGFGVMMLDISIGSIFAAVIPDRLRSRVAGAYMMVNYGVRPIGALLGGILGSAVGLRPTLWMAAAFGLTGFLWLLPSGLLRMRTLPEAAEAGPAATGTAV